MNNNLNLNKVHRSLYNELKRKAFSIEGSSDELKSYQKTQDSYSKRKFTNSTLEELNKSVLKSNIIYLGDFHSFDQSSRNLKRILKILSQTSKTKQITIGVEFVHQDQQGFIDDFLDGLITENEFLESINYHESWKFPWHHYKQFFDYAITFDWKILALNTVGNLKERDLAAAKQIVKHTDSNTKMIVIFGELHILPNKLPSLTEKESSKKINQLIIHQNLDHVFWKVANKKVSNEKIVKFNSKEFCIISAPPWIKYESMIHWYENMIDFHDFELNDATRVNHLALSDQSMHDSFTFIIKKLSQTFSLNYDTRLAEDFHLFDYKSLDKLIKKSNKEKSPIIKNFSSKLIENGFTFKLLGSNNYFCSNFSINKVSYLAGLHFLNISSETSHSAELKSINMNNSQRFLLLFKYHFFGYICSKTINPFRKCDLFYDIKIKSKKDKINLLSLNVLKSKSINSLGNNLNSLRLFEVFRISKIVGYMIGDIFFDNQLSDPKKMKYLISILDNSKELDQKEFLFLKNNVINYENIIDSKKRYF